MSSKLKLVIPDSPSAAGKAHFDPKSGHLLIDVVPSTTCVVIFDLYYCDKGSKPVTSDRVLRLVDAESFSGWIPPDPLPALADKKIWVVFALKPIGASGVIERIVVDVFQPPAPNRIDDTNGTFACPIPAAGAAFVQGAIEVTFQ